MFHNIVKTLDSIRKDAWELWGPYNDNLSLFADKLPHGRGIDIAWAVGISRKYFKFYNAYHVMNDGFYIGWVHFTLAIARDGSDWKIMIDSDDQSFARDYQIRDYLEETFAYALSEIEKELAD